MPKTKTPPVTRIIVLVFLFIGFLFHISFSKITCKVVILVLFENLPTDHEMYPKNEEKEDYSFMDAQNKS